MDKNEVKKVLTFKSGQFVFSCLYNNQKLSELLNTAKILYITIADLPILPDLASQLEAELIRKAIFATAAIEGNPLSEDRVEEILTETKDKEKLKRAEKEIENLKQVYERVKNVKINPSEPVKLTEQLIKDLQGGITKGIPYEDNNPGHYRSHPVTVGNKEHGGCYRPPKILKDIENLMPEFILWINSEQLLQEDPAIRAALAHYHLGLIHPFGQGNGRTARLVEAILLKSAGIKFVAPMLSNFYYQKIDDYYWAFSLARKNKDCQVTPFLEFFLQGLIVSLEEIKKRIAGIITGIMLKEYYGNLRKRKEITQRQYELLRVLLVYQRVVFSFQALFTEPVFQILYRSVSRRTARRDLSKLKTNNLLIEKDRLYSLNWSTLE